MSGTNTNEAVDLRAATNDDLKEMGLPPAFTLDELAAFLSEAEVKLLQDGEDPLFDSSAAAKEAQEETTAGDAGDGNGNDADDDNDENTDTEGDDDQDGDEGNAEGADGGKGAETETPPEQAATAPTFVEAPADSNDPVRAQIDVTAAKTIVDGAAAERKAITAKFNDGELSEDEFDAALEALTDKVADARADIRDAARTAESHEKAYQSAWYAKTGEFMKANPDFANNDPVPQLGGSSRIQLFDEALKRITADPGYASLKMSEKINQAARLAVGYFKQATGTDFLTPPKAPAAAKDTGKQPAKTTTTTKAAAEQPKRPDPGQRPPPVRTLGGVSQASGMEVDDGKFAAVDRAVGVAAEQEFSRMTQAEKDAYLRGA